MNNPNKKWFLKLKNHPVKSKNYVCVESPLYVQAVFMLFKAGLDLEITQFTGLILVLYNRTYFTLRNLFRKGAFRESGRLRPV